ncbi:MAG: glutamate racemase [Bacteroidota bacterium]
MSKKINTATRPLGIFDSGIGGLTVASAIHQLMPNEQIVYFGDTAHLPYGDKSPESIRKWAIAISDFLMTFNCKVIVIACNSISSVAYDLIKEHVGNRAIIVNVIDPVVEYVCQQPKLKSVGVIGTKATIKTDIYAKKIKSNSKAINVSSLATPLLAPMIEEGFFNNKISKTIINDYLSRPKLKGINSLILGCTHYPLIKPEIEQYYKGKVTLFDTAGIVAQHTKEILLESGLLNSGKSKKHHFFVSEYTSAFAESTKLFFKGKVKLEHKNLWK